MDPADSPDVLEEVEALFKKLQHLPESIRQKALSCIQKKLPDSQSPRVLEDTSPKSSSKHRKGSSPRKLQDAAQSPNSVRGSPRKKALPIDSATDSVSGPKKPADENKAQMVKESAHDPVDEEESGRDEAGQTHSSSNDKTKVLSRARIKKEKVGSTVSQDEIKSSFVVDEGSQAVLVEDIRTLHGRRTKRINVANLIRGVRKPKLQTSQAKPVATVPKSREVVLEKVSPRNIFRKNVPVPSDVAESAEILASLSNEISQKDLSHGIILNVNIEQTDCLKDKTNNQGNEDVSTAVALSSEEEPQAVNIKLESANSNEDNESCDDEAHEDEAVSDPLIEDDEDIGSSDADESAAFSCHFCEFKCKTKFALAVHVKKHKENIPKASSKTSSKALYACTECNKTFSQACGLQLHIKRHRNERDFACPDCDYKAYTKVDLTRHQTIHTGERNKVCEFCGKAFAKDSTLRDHVKAIHERKVRHECEVCGFVTHRANNLRVHIRMRHHGEYNNHVCPVCNASVKQKNAFLEHMRSHTGERPYKCEECTASFACLARLNVHRNAVHGERLFKCGDCDKSFQTKHHLLRHHAIHTKERPYACPYCSYACNTQGNIAKHVRSIHNYPDFSYRKYKLMQENGGQLREVDPEWVRKGEEVTKEYLNSLSSKLGREITLDELWDKEKELQKKKEEQEKARVAQKEQRAAKGETVGGTTFLPKVRKRTLGNKKVKNASQSSTHDDPDDPQILIQGLESGGDEEGSSDLPFYKLVSQNGNIQLCLETDEVQVYTGDATRELSLLQMKNDGILTDGEEIQTIQGYMNEHGQFVRLDEGTVVGEDSSTVVVIIDSELNEGMTPEVADVMEVTCEEPVPNVTSNKRSIECDVPMSQDSKRKRSVIRIIKEELPD